MRTAHLTLASLAALVLLGAPAVEAKPVISVRGGHGQATTRAANALVARELGSRLAHAPHSFHLDATITRIAIEPTPHGTAVAVTIRVAVSDARGAVISLCDGAARAESIGPFRRAVVERDALTAAVAGMTTRLDQAIRGARSSYVAAR